MSRGHRKNIFSPDYKYIGIHSKLKGDKIKTVMNFTSTLLELLDKNAEDEAPEIKNPGIPKKKKPHKNVKNVHQLGGFNQQPKGFQNFQQFHNSGFDGFGNQGGYNQSGFGFPQQQQQEKGWNSFNMPSNNFNQGGDKYKVSTSTRTSTETRNGKTVTKTVETIKYSDGTIEENETRQQS